MKQFTIYNTPEGEFKLERKQEPVQEIKYHGFESDTFTERTDINEFLRDGAVINALYDLTLQHLFENRTRNVESKVLEVFNNAYKICWMITSKGANYADALSGVFGRRYNFFVRDLSQFVTWSILKVYGEYYEFDESILDSLRNRTQDKSMFSSYRELVRMQDDPCHPICFGTPGIRHSRVEFCIDGQEAYPHDATNIFEILGNYDAHNSELDAGEVNDEQHERAPIDRVVEQSLAAIRAIYNVVKSDNDRLTCTMAEMESSQRKTVEGMEATISQLRSQIVHLTKQLEAKKGEVRVKEVIKENPLQKILNWDTITNYALGLGDYREVQVLCNMFNRMSARNRYYNQNLMDNIDKLEAYIRELQKPVVNQINQGCQQFYGEVSNSEFKTSKTNE